MANIFSKLFSKKNRKWTIPVLAVVVVAALVGVQYAMARRSRVPKGIALGNGRLESKQVDVSPKQALRVKQIFVAEGDLVKPGQVVVQMDTNTLQAQLAEAKAGVAGAQEKLAGAKATIAKQKSQIELAKVERSRSRRLVAERAGSQRDLDVRTMAVKSTTAALGEANAELEVALKEVDEARAKVTEVQSQIDDATLKSPVFGRVLYRLAEPGEVLSAGGKALTLINLEDVYMEIFLPSSQAAALRIGDDARITLDVEPNKAGAGWVSFVSPEAQFTPKEVETRSEREKLMFRVKIQVPRDLVVHYTERIKTGVRGVGYVKIDKSTGWPDWLQKNLVNPEDVGRVGQLQPAAPAPVKASATTNPQ
jgi:HlyD family secretion protein